MNSSLDGHPVPDGAGGPDKQVAFGPTSPRHQAEEAEEKATDLAGEEVQGLDLDDDDEEYIRNAFQVSIE